MDSRFELQKGHEGSSKWNMAARIPRSGMALGATGQRMNFSLGWIFADQRAFQTSAGKGDGVGSGVGAAASYALFKENRPELVRVHNQ